MAKTNNPQLKSSPRFPKAGSVRKKEYLKNNRWGREKKNGREKQNEKSLLIPFCVFESRAVLE